MRAVLVAVVLASCHAKDEARSLVTALDAFRQAPNDDKPTRADAFDKVPCTDDDVCAVKATCTKSVDATAKGLRLQQEVQKAVAAKAGDPDDLAAKWKEASSDLEMGYGLLPACREKASALRDRFGI